MMLNTRQKKIVCNIVLYNLIGEFADRSRDVGENENEILELLEMQVSEKVANLPVIPCTDNLSELIAYVEANY